MKIFVLAIAAFFLSAVQLTIAPKFSILGAAPDLILAGALSLAIIAKDPAVKWLVFGWALFFDLLAGEPFGILTLSFFLVFFFIGWLTNSWLKQSGFLAVLSLGVLGITSFYSLVFLFQKIAAFFFTAAVPAPEFFRFLSDFIPAALYNLPVFLALFYLLLKFKRSLRSQKII